MCNILHDTYEHEYNKNKCNILHIIWVVDLLYIMCIINI